MSGKQNTFVWIVYTKHSNKYKLQQFRETQIPSNLRVQFIDADKIEIRNNSENGFVFFNKGARVELPDICFSLVVDRDTNLRGFEFLEQLSGAGVRIVNSLSSVAAVSDKFTSGKVIQSLGYPYPKSFLISKNYLDEVQKTGLEYPFILKPLHGRKSRGVQIIRSQSELADYFEQYQLDRVLAQEFIAESFRSDIRVYVLGGKILGALRRTAHAKTFSDVRVQKIKLSQKLAERSVKIASEFGLDFCCVDYFTDAENTVCEVNAFPGFLKYDAEFHTPLSQEICNFLAKIPHSEFE